MASFVLVHGAWHGGWCWHKVVARLEARSHRVAAPDMRGHGIDRMPPEATTLANIADGIVSAVEAQGEPVVLVGHSFGGAIIGEVAERIPSKVKRLVYLAAMVVPGGKSPQEVMQDDADSLLGPHLRFASDGSSVTVDPDHLRECFYAQCPEEDVALARLLLVPEGLAAFSTPLSATAARWGTVPSAYIECVRDKAIGVARQRYFAGLLSKPKRISLDTDHSPFFSQPSELADALESLT